MNIKDKVKTLFCRKKLTEQEAYDIIHAQFTKITQQEIRHTKQKLDEEFQRLLKDCEADNEQTLSIERTQEILKSLIALSVSRRQKLIDDLKGHVESGNIFNYYNNQIKEIDCLQTDLTTQMRYKKYLEKDYETEKSIYDKKVAQTYIDEYLPDEQNFNSIKKDKKEIEEELLADLQKGMEDDKW